MGAVDSYWFNVAKYGIANGTVHPLTDTMKVTMYPSSNTALTGANLGEDIATVAAIGTKITGLTDQTVALSSANDTTNDWTTYFVTATPDPAATFTAVTTGQTIRWIVIYTGTTPVFCAKLASDCLTNGGDIKLSWGASAIVAELKNA